VRGFLLQNCKCVIGTAIIDEDHFVRTGAKRVEDATQSAYQFRQDAFFIVDGNGNRKVKSSGHTGREAPLVGTIGGWRKACQTIGGWRNLYIPRIYSKRIRTISGLLPTRIGGPHVPAPLEV
jgi:hypothetical protein